MPSWSRSCSRTLQGSSSTKSPPMAASCRSERAQVRPQQRVPTVPRSQHRFTAGTSARSPTCLPVVSRYGSCCGSDDSSAATATASAGRSSSRRNTSHHGAGGEVSLLCQVLTSIGLALAGRVGARLAAGMAIAGVPDDAAPAGAGSTRATVRHPTGTGCRRFRSAPRTCVLDDLAGHGDSLADRYPRRPRSRHAHRMAARAPRRGDRVPRPCRRLRRGRTSGRTGRDPGR